MPHTFSKQGYKTDIKFVVSEANDTRMTYPLFLAKISIAYTKMKMHIKRTACLLSDKEEKQRYKTSFSS